MKSKKRSPMQISDSPIQSSIKTKKYKTFSKPNKLIIIRNLMKELHIPLEGNKVDPEYIFNCLAKIDLNEYNQALARILLTYVESYVDTTNNRKKWRRKIKEWIENVNKPETRGGVIVPDDQLDWFKEHLIPILLSLPFRSYDLLKDKLLTLVEEMRENDSNNNTKSFKKTCSKHFWYDFLDKNPDLAELYDSLPDKKKTKKESVKPRLNYQTEESEDETAETSNSPLEQISQPILSLETNRGLFEDSNFNFPSNLEEMTLASIHAVDLTQNHRVIAQQEQDNVPQISMENKEHQFEHPTPGLFYRRESMIVEPVENTYQMECYRGYFEQNDEFDEIYGGSNTISIDPDSENETKFVMSKLWSKNEQPIDNRFSLELFVNEVHGIGAYEGMQASIL